MPLPDTQHIILSLSTAATPPKVPQQVFRRFRFPANTLACERLTDGLLRA